MNKLFDFVETPIEQVEEKKYVPNIFTILKYLTYQKRKWEALTLNEQESVEVWMLNNWISHIPYLCVGIDEVQHLLLSMSKEQVYKFYYGILPSKKLDLVWVKGKFEKEIDYIVTVISDIYQITYTDARHQYEFMLSINKIEYLIELIEGYGLDNKEEKLAIKYLKKI